jgi:hypothetical protein
MEYTKLVTQIIDLANEFRKGNTKRVKEAIAIKEALESSSSKFKESFITDYFDEVVFSALTGLNVSADCIKYYIDFKNKLGRTYTWKSIESIKYFIKLGNDNVVRVVISK